MGCGAPTTTRTVHVSDHSELFWWCAPNGPDTGHVMIGMNTSGYAISAFTPTQTFTDVTSICWDQNLTDLGGGKWMVLTLVPGAVFGGRLDYTLPEFDADNGPGDFNLQRQSRWQFKLFRNQLRIFNSIPGSPGGNFATDAGFVAGSDRATRYRHCLTENASGLIVVSQQRPGGVSSWVSASRFPDGPVTVIWADDTYDADKHGGTGLYTWHFDNIEIRTS